MHLFGCPISWHKIELGRQVRWIGLDMNFFSCFWQIPKDKRDKAFQIIQKVSRQGNELDRVDLERLVSLLMWFSESMPALGPWRSDFSLALARPTETLLSLSRIQFGEATNRASVKIVLISHPELSGLRHGWRRNQVPGKNVDSPNKALEIRCADAASPRPSTPFLGFADLEMLKTNDNHHSPQQVPKRNISYLSGLRDEQSVLYFDHGLSRTLTGAFDFFLNHIQVGRQCSADRLRRTHDLRVVSGSAPVQPRPNSHEGLSRIDSFFKLQDLSPPM